MSGSLDEDVQERYTDDPVSGVDKEAWDALAEEEGYESWAEWVAKVDREYDYQICGWKTRDDRPCREDIVTGEIFCQHHTESARLARIQTKRRFIQEYIKRRGAVEEAAVACGIALNTVYQWRQYHPEFKEEMDRAYEEEIIPKQVDAVKANLFQRVSTGQAAASEVIFWLCNMAPEEFMDVKKIVTEDTTDVLGQLREAFQELQEAGRLPDRAVEASSRLLEDGEDVAKLEEELE